MTPYFQNAMVTIYHGNCCEVMPEITGCSAIVTDPPYELGFMGKAWDKSEVGFDLGTWWIALKCCLPGAHMLAFGGSRTFHRVASAIENAGWEIRDTLMWLYGSGFPKSRDIGKELPGWAGYGTNLKPAYECITLARKRLSGTVAANALEHGCGALNIDECRVGTNDDLNGGIYRGVRTSDSGMLGVSKHVGDYSQPIGRWPANIITDGSEEVLRGFPQSTPGQDGTKETETKRTSLFNGGRQGLIHKFRDEGSAARFFYCAKASGDERDDNTHATVKPLALMEYLCRLIKQPERNLVLDPFAGSGTTLLACELLSIPCIGIELDEGHCEIIAKRFSKPAEPYLL